MNKLNERLTLIANLSVVAGIIFLAVELQQNTQAIQAQTRDSITEKQMSWLESLYTNPGATEILVRGDSGTDEFDATEARLHSLLTQATGMGKLPLPVRTWPVHARRV